MTTTQAQSPTPSAASSTAASASLYVGDLAPEVTEPEIHTVFSAVGPLESVRVCRDSATRRSLGYAYVNFYKVEDAERALDTLNFKPIRDRACRIMWSHRDPSLRKSGVGNIFVNHLARSIDNKTLFDTFSVFGNILSAKVATNGKGESLGYAFVHFETAQAATDAIARVDGKVIAESKVSVSAFISKKDRGVDKKTRFTNVYAKNLPLDWNKEKVDQLFGKHGKITSSMFTVDTSDKKRGAFAFINFAAPEEANAAIQALNNLEVGKDQKLVVVRHQKKAEREKELRQKFETLRQEKARQWANCNLYIKNLPDDWDEAKLRDEFKVFGGISSVRLMLDQDTKKSRGFGFVCFATPEDAQKAVQEMNNKRYDDKPLFVGIAQRKEVRRANLDTQRRMYRQGGYNGYPNPQQMGGFPPQQFWGGRQQGFYPPQNQMNQMGPMGMGGQNMGPQGRAWGPMPGWGPRQPFQGGPNGQQGGGRGRGGQGGQRGGPQMGRGGGGRGQMQQNGAPQQQFQGNGREHKAQGPANGVQYGENVRNVQSRPMQQAPVQSEAPRQEQQIAPGAPLTIKQLAAAPEKQQKQMIGEQLFPRIKGIEPKLAGKITGMLLEMDNGELIHLLESQEALQEKVSEAKEVLEGHGSE